MGDNTIKFKYIFDDDYNPTYVNGAQGGINVQGEIIMNFYLERLALPNSQTHSMTPNGMIDELVDTDPKDLNKSFVRFIKNGVVMNIQTAKNIHSWLGDIIKNYEDALKIKKD